MSRKVFALCFVLLTGVSLVAQTTPDLQNAQKELGRIRDLVSAGAMPRNALEKAEQEIADAQDNAVLNRTLYGALTIEDLSEQQTEEMLVAARNRVARQEAKLQHQQGLVTSGVLAPAELSLFKDELEIRRTALRLAEHRAQLFHQLTEMAHNEARADEEPLAARMGNRIAMRFDGKGAFSDKDFSKVELAFVQHFARPLPVSAKGETALHKSLGFDHRGRVDIALNPDQPEGLWLRHYLESAKIPYFAFRSAVAGKATAPHIHLGPPSLRLRVAD